MNNHNYDSAFPVVLDYETQKAYDTAPLNQSGISIRDYFAAKAMAAYIHKFDIGADDYDIASSAFGVANMMMEQRKV